MQRSAWFKDMLLIFFTEKYETLSENPIVNADGYFRECEVRRCCPSKAVFRITV